MAGRWWCKPGRENPQKKKDRNEGKRKERRFQEKKKKKRWLCKRCKTSLALC